MIPQLLLEEILAGEKNAQDYYETYGKENVEAALAELKASNEEILSQYPVEKMRQEFVKKSFVVKQPKSKRPLFVAAAAVLALAVVSPVIYENLKTPEPSSETTGIRLKGNSSSQHQLRIYKKDGNKAVALKNGDSAAENDSVQITYIPGEYNYGLIFSFDGNGNVTKHFPENGWKAGKLEKTGEEVPLSFSYVLDDAPAYECFVFVASKNKFDMSKFEKEIKNKRPNTDDLSKGVYFPEGCDGAIFLLKK